MKAVPSGHVVALWNKAFMGVIIFVRFRFRMSGRCCRLGIKATGSYGPASAPGNRVTGVKTLAAPSDAVREREAARRRDDCAQSARPTKYFIRNSIIAS